MIQVELSADIQQAVSVLAARGNISQDKVIGDLLQKALEDYEDELWSRLAAKRLAENKTWLSHQDVWAQFGLT